MNEGIIKRDLKTDMADRVICQIGKISVGESESISKAVIDAKDALRLTGFSDFTDPDVHKLIEALGALKANKMTSLTAACLLLDYRTLESLSA